MVHRQDQRSIHPSLAKKNKDWYIPDTPELIEKLLEEFEVTPARAEFDTLQRQRSYR
jgi:hypothetical protein